MLRRTVPAGKTLSALTATRQWSLAAVAGLGLVLAACGSAAGSGGSAATGSSVSASTTTTATPPVQRTVAGPFPSSGASPAHPGNVVTVANDRTTVSVVVGQQLTVELAPAPAAWDQPRLTGSGLRLVSVTGGYPQLVTMRAVYVGTSPGTVVLSSSTDLQCLHARPRCLVAQRLWTVQVIIRARPA